MKICICVIQELLFVFYRLNNKRYHSSNILVAVALINLYDIVIWSKMKLNRRERTSPSALVWVITYPLDTGRISCFFFSPFVIHLHSSILHHPMKYMYMHVNCFHSNARQQVWVSQVLGDEWYKWMSRVTGLANNLKILCCLMDM